MMAHMRPANLTGWVVALCALVASGCAHRGSARTGGDEAPPGLQVVRAFVAAFNAQDPDAMVALTHPDVEWLSVDGDRVSVDARGHDALREAMTGYFASTKNVASALEALLATGRFVTARERVFWDTGTGEARTQAALSVYELEGERIRRVWYFPAEP